MKNGSLIPSRREKKTRGISWKATWKNLTLLRGLGPEEKCFGWKVTQDMVEVGQRMHRKGAQKECQNLVENGEECKEIESVEHRLFLCDAVGECGDAVIHILGSFLHQNVETEKV